MRLAPVHHAVRHAEVRAPAGVLYGLISDALRWPVFLPPTVHVEQLESDGESERLRMWATANGEVRSWTSRRVLDPVAYRVDFRQEVLSRPVASMGGTWAVEPLGPESSRVSLRNDFTVADDLPADRAWVRRAAESNSRASLDHLRRLAERWHRLADLVLSFEDSVLLDAPAERVHDLLHGGFAVPGTAVPAGRAAGGGRHGPAVRLAAVERDGPGGERELSTSVRLGFPRAGRVVYKEIPRAGDRPALLSARAGEWSVVPDAAGTGTAVIARHHAVLDEDGVRERYGGGAAAVRTAREELGERLAAESASALRLAGEQAAGGAGGGPAGARAGLR